MPRCSWKSCRVSTFYLNSGGSFSYQHTVQPPTHGRLEMIKYGRGLAYYLPNFPVGANGDGDIATVYCTGSRWNADHRVSRLGYILKGQVVKRVQKLVTFLYKWIWFHTCPPCAPLDFFLEKHAQRGSHFPPTHSLFLPGSSRAAAATTGRISRTFPIVTTKTIRMVDAKSGKKGPEAGTPVVVYEVTPVP